jgi:hypothetical protein
VREFHPNWLARKPKGFIPELTDAYALMWLDHRVAEGSIDGSERRELEKMRRKALKGSLSHNEFQRLQARTHGEMSPLRSFLSTLHSARRCGTRVPRMSPAILAELDRFIARVEAMQGTNDRVASLASHSRERRIARTRESSSLRA